MGEPLLVDGRFWRLRDERRFGWLLRTHQTAVVVVWHHLCPACGPYKQTVDRLAPELARASTLGLGHIHLQLPWMIRAAGLQGDVEVENAFLTRYGIGDAVPVTLRFEAAQLQQRVVGALDAAQFRALCNDGTMPDSSAPVHLRATLRGA